jgi:membrane protein YqaA with SNARE-associated domain
MKPTHRTTLLRVLSLLAVIGISIWIFSIRDKAEELAVYGYPGIFIIALLANATVLLPAPGVAVVFAMGAVFNPFIVGIVSGVGSGLGELSSYLLGYSGQAVVENTTLYNRILPWMQRYAPATIFILAAIPNPFFDLAGIASGILKIPARIFLFWCIAGKIIKMLIFAYAGAYSVDWLFKYLK